MPARTYYFSSPNITRDRKHKKAIPNSQWKGPGSYYLRENAAGTERYWAKRNISMDAKRSRPKKIKISAMVFIHNTTTKGQANTTLRKSS